MKMNIGIFTDTYFPQVNGVTYTIDLWKERLSDTLNGANEVSIYYPKSTYTPQENEFPFKSLEFRFYQEYRIAVPVRISRKSKNLDIVHIHGLFSMAIAGMYVSKRHKLPRILTYHTPADEYLEYITRRQSLKKTLMKIYNAWEKKLLNSCDIVTAPSYVIKERLLDKGVNDVLVLSNGIDLDFFRRVETAAFRKKHNICSGRVIGFCGRLGYEKHVEDLIDISDEFDGEILIAGKGPAGDYYEKLAEGKKNIKFLGFLSRKDLLEFYSTLDLFIFPSTAETQGLVALEAMACGTPVIAVNRLALKDTVTDSKTGYLYERGDLHDLVEKIHKGYDNRQKLSENCLEYVKEHSVDRTIEKLLELYAGLV